VRIAVIPVLSVMAALMPVIDLRIFHCCHHTLAATWFVSALVISGKKQNIFVLTWSLYWVFLIRWQISNIPLSRLLQYEKDYYLGSWLWISTQQVNGWSCILHFSNT
jgi:hypothetical protein